MLSLRYASASCKACILELDNAHWEANTNPDMPPSGDVDTASDGATFQNTAHATPQRANEALSGLAIHFKRIAVGT